jgi:hypothetical protein
VAIVAAITVATFSGAWISGQSPVTVAGATVFAALLGVAGVTVLGPVFRNRVFRVVAHLLLGLFVLVVALLITLLSAAEGALTRSVATVAILGSVWGVGITLVLAGIMVAVDARRPLRVVATAGLAVTAIWGLVVLLIVGSLVVDLLTAGIDQSLAQDVEDDLLPFLVAFVTVLVVPALVFLQDWRASR